MEEKYANLLSGEPADLLMEIEGGTGASIAVTVDPKRRVMACEIIPERATIITFSEKHFPNDSVFHELLHIKRIALQGEPQVIDCDDCEYISPQIMSALMAVDNDLEHVHIVPIEAKAFPQRIHYWNRRISEALKTMRDKLGAEDLKRHVLLKGLFAHAALPESDVIREIRLMESELGIVELAAEFRERMTAEAQKAAEVLVAFRYLNIPFNIASLEYIDLKTGTSKEVPLVAIA